jgi:hypothetical protein
MARFGTSTKIFDGPGQTRARHTDEPRSGASVIDPIGFLVAQRHTAVEDFDRSWTIELIGPATSTPSIRVLFSWSPIVIIQYPSPTHSHHHDDISRRGKFHEEYPVMSAKAVFPPISPHIVNLLRCSPVRRDNSSRTREMRPCRRRTIPWRLNNIRKQSTWMDPTMSTFRTVRRRT